MSVLSHQDKNVETKEKFTMKGILVCSFHTHSHTHTFIYTIPIGNQRYSGKKFFKCISTHIHKHFFTGASFCVCGFTNRNNIFVLFGKVSLENGNFKNIKQKNCSTDETSKERNQFRNGRKHDLYYIGISMPCVCGIKLHLQAFNWWNINSIKSATIAFRLTYHNISCILYIYTRY